MNYKEILMVHNMNKKTRQNSGFTIIEMMFSLAIFAILFIAISSLMITTLKISQNTKHQYRATLLAQKRFEEIKTSKDILEGLYNYECNDYILDEEIIEVEGYKGRVYKIIIKVSLKDEILETIEGLKIIKK